MLWGSSKALYKNAMNYDSAIQGYTVWVLTGDAAPHGARLFEQGVCEGLARRGLARAAAAQRAHTVVPARAHQGHVHPLDQGGQGRGRLPHTLPPPGLWRLGGEGGATLTEGGMVVLGWLDRTPSRDNRAATKEQQRAENS